MLFLFFLFGLLHTCNCLLRTCSLRLTGKKYHWESTTFPRISILPVVKVRGSTILLAGGLQREPGVDITGRKGVKYLEDQNRRYGRDKMPPLLCRILKLRESSSEQVLNNKGQKGVRVNTFLLAA